jgi:hypothetical protein
VAEALWTRAQALGLTPLNDREAEALMQSTGGDPRLTLSWVGRVLQTPGLSVAYFYESLLMPSKKAPVPDAQRVLQDALAQDGLPPWDAVHDHTGTPQLVWVRSYGLQSRVHAAVDLEGSQRFMNWKAPSFWQRLFGPSTDPIHQGAGVGACAVQDSIGCPHFPLLR